MRGQEERQEDSTANDDAPVHVIPGVACGAGADGVIRWDGREGWVDDVEAVLLCAGGASVFGTRKPGGLEEGREMWAYRVACYSDLRDIQVSGRQDGAAW